MIINRLAWYNHDNRYSSNCILEETEIQVADSKEELLAKCNFYLGKVTFDGHAYSEGTDYRFVGPIEVVHNVSYDDDEKTTEFEPWGLDFQDEIIRSIKEQVVLYQLTK